MEKRISKFLGVILVLIGAVLLSNSAGITGFAILQNIGKTTGSIFGIVFVIVGVLLLVTREEEERRYRINEIMKKYEHGEISPMEAAREVNDILQINSVRFKADVKHSITGPTGGYSIKVKSGNRAKELALAFYEVARINSPKNVQYCELHLSEQASTKHHKKGFEEELLRFERKYRKELEEIVAP